jgi:hypothetical protein
MRYYELTLTNPAGQIWQPNPSGLGFIKSARGTTFSSLVVGPNGQPTFNPNALGIYFDFPVVPFNTPRGQAIIRISGVGIGMIGQAANLNGSTFKLQAGMWQGMPLAKPAQRGLIGQGQIFQAFGNWQGVDQTLDLICYPGAAAPVNIPFSWPKDTPLSTAIAAALYGAFPTYRKPEISISNLITPVDQKAIYLSLDAFADMIHSVSLPLGKAIHGPDYAGVQISLISTTFRVFDFTVLPPVKMLAFEDLIGQPTWIEPAKINFKCTLRADLGLSDQVQFPQGVAQPYVLTASSAVGPNTPAADKTTFTQSFLITSVNHFANSRQPDWDSWATSFEAVPLPKQTPGALSLAPG